MRGFNTSNDTDAGQLRAITESLIRNSLIPIENPSGLADFISYLELLEELSEDIIQVGSDAPDAAAIEANANQIYVRTGANAGVYVSAIGASEWTRVFTLANMHVGTAAPTAADAVMGLEQLYFRVGENAGIFYSLSDADTWTSLQISIEVNNDDIATDISDASTTEAKSEASIKRYVDGADVAEATARQNADATEATARQNADATEATARQAGDAALETRVETVENRTTTANNDDFPDGVADASETEIKSEASIQRFVEGRVSDGIEPVLIFNRSATTPPHPTGSVANGVLTLNGNWDRYIPLLVGGTQSGTIALHSANTFAKGIARHNGKTYVVDDPAPTGTSRVFIYDSAGAYESQWDCHANNTNPEGITITPDGKVFIPDGTGERFYEYTLAGAHQNTFNFPIGAYILGASSDADYLYFLNSNIKTVYRYHHDGSAAGGNRSLPFTGAHNFHGLAYANGRDYIINRFSTSHEILVYRNGVRLTTEGQDLASGNTVPVGIAVEGKRFFVPDSADNEIYIYGTDTAEENPLHISEAYINISANTVTFSEFWTVYPKTAALTQAQAENGASTVQGTVSGEVLDAVIIGKRRTEAELRTILSFTAAAQADTIRGASVSGNTLTLSQEDGSTLDLTLPSGVNGVTLSGTTLTFSLSAGADITVDLSTLQSMVEDDSVFILPSELSGTNALTATLAETATAYTSGDQYLFVIEATNTGNVTINIDGLGSRNVRKSDDSVFAAGEWVAGRLVTLTHDGAIFRADIDPSDVHALTEAEATDEDSTVQGTVSGDVLEAVNSEHRYHRRVARVFRVGDHHASNDVSLVLISDEQYDLLISRHTGADALPESYLNRLQPGTEIRIRKADKTAVWEGELINVHDDDETSAELQIDFSVRTGTFATGDAVEVDFGYASASIETTTSLGRARGALIATASLPTTAAVGIMTNVSWTLPTDVLTGVTISSTNTYRLLLPDAPFDDSVIGLWAVAKIGDTEHSSAFIPWGPGALQTEGTAQDIGIASLNYADTEKVDVHYTHSTTLGDNLIFYGDGDTLPANAEVEFYIATVRGPKGEPGDAATLLTQAQVTDPDSTVAGSISGQRIAQALAELNQHVKLEKTFTTGAIARQLLKFSGTDNNILEMRADETLPPNYLLEDIIGATIVVMGESSDAIRVGFVTAVSFATLTFSITLTLSKETGTFTDNETCQVYLSVALSQERLHEWLAPVEIGSVDLDATANINWISTGLQLPSTDQGFWLYLNLGDIQTDPGGLGRLANWPKVSIQAIHDLANGTPGSTPTDTQALVFPNIGPVGGIELWLGKDENDVLLVADSGSLEYENLTILRSWV